MTEASVRKAAIRMRMPPRRQVNGSHGNTLRISRARLFDFGSLAGPATGFGEAPSSAAR
jgi:hypothetical protein